MRDFERYARTVEAFERLAMIRIMLKRLMCPRILVGPVFSDRRKKVSNITIAFLEKLLHWTHAILAADIV
jgi:hypothetical protein